MATLTGKITDVTHKQPESLSSITVKAPSVRVGGGTDLIVSSPATVEFDRDTGDVTISGLTGGLSWLYLEGEGWSDSIPLAVAEGMITLVEAIANASGVPGMPDYVSMIRSSGDHALLLARAAVDGEFGDIVRAAQNSAETAEQAATSAENTVDAYTPRVDALEAMAGLSPESPVDGQTANLISQSDSLTRTAAENAIREVAVTVREAPLNPYRFGAVEPLDNNDDHTLALRAMFEAASESSSGSDIRLPPGKWIFKNSDGLGPLPLSTGLKVVGTGSHSSRLYARETDGVALLGSESHVKGVEMRDLMLLISGNAGHIFQTRGLGRGTFSNVFFIQQLADWSIWNQMAGDWIQNVFTSCELQGSATARQPWFNLESAQGGLNSNTFDKCRFNGLNGTGAPVFRIDDTAPGAQVNDWAFRDIILEQTTGGFIHASGASNWILDNVQSWDAQVSHAADILRFDKATGGGFTHNLTFRNYSRHGESLASGVYDISIVDAAPRSGVATFINCNPTPYTRNHSINSPRDRTVYIATRGYSTHQSSGAGSPEGVISGSVGDVYTRTDGGAGSTLYVKESGEGTSTGWVAK